MARTFSLKVGATTIDLISTSPGIAALYGRLGGYTIPEGVLGGGRIPETYELVMRHTTVDNVAAQFQAFVKLVFLAKMYHEGTWQRDPGYLIQEVEGETNTRYAMVYTALELEIPDLFLSTLEESYMLKTITLTLVREHPWRSGAPGTIGSAITLAESDGPASPSFVHIANHQDDHEIDRIYRYDRGAVWAADFESGDPDRMWIADNASLSTGDIDFFIAGWFTLESNAADSILLGKWDNVAANREYCLYLASGLNRFRFYVNDGVGNDSILANNFGALSLSVEYFVIAWHTAGTSEIGVSVNGVVDTKVSARNPQDGTRNFTIGSQQGGGGPYDGLAKSCGMWKAECTAALRTSLYNSGVPKFYSELTAAELTGLEAYWEFGGGGLAFVNDSEGANNLTNAGATQIVGTAGSYSADLAGTAAHDLFPATPQPNDIYYIGSASPFFHTVFNIGTAAVYTTLALAYEYSDNAAGWPDCVLGTDLTLYPDEELWDQTGQAVINFAGNTAWAAEAVNGDTRFWLRVRITACTVFTTPPSNATNVVYNQHTPHIEVPAASIKGDAHPTFLLRLKAPAGGDDTPSFANTSRILIGAKSSGLTKFVSHLNAGGDGNPAEWTVTQGTDATSTASGDAPGGDYSHVDFAGETGWAMRVQFTGAEILNSWEDDYIAIVRCEQTAGDAGDLEIKLRMFIEGTADYDVHVDTPAVLLAGVAEGPEAVDLGLISIPFARSVAADTLTGTDLVFQIWARRNAGAGELKIYDNITLPISEGSVGADDPVSDLDYGPSALRGATALDIDAGVIEWRAQRYTIVGGNLIPSLDWAMMNEPIKFEKLATKTRLYFLLLHYPTAWGTGPLIAEMGMHLTFEMYGHYRYAALRGAD